MSTEEWALFMQALLNERHYNKLLEDYGTKLTKEAAFGDLLKSLVSTRVAPLIKNLCANPSYQEEAAQGRFEFLRNAEVFRKAMNDAQDQFNWSKKSS